MNKATRFFRHPVRSITEPYGKAGLLVAILALVLATTGAAFAAGGLSKSQEKQVKKIVAAEVKKHPGPAGPAGANGTNGQNGAPGEKGAKGDTGSNGVSAEAGTAFAGNKTVGSVHCENGGVPVKSASPETAVCNGKNGTTGFTKTLPPSETETGTWVGRFAPSGSWSAVQFAVSFTIPLSAALPEANIEVKEPGFEGAAGENCPGKAAEPKAKAEFLCIYTVNEAAPFTLALPQVNTATGVVEALINITGSTVEGTDSGTWAVTAP